ncbi:MAG: hypothetical protein KAF91_03825 [Nostoc sp. TH1S01]|nr:hypothetical protein [Nostoc sp. TH1S01]
MPPAFCLLPFAVVIWSKSGDCQGQFTIEQELKNVLAFISLQRDRFATIP